MMRSNVVLPHPEGPRKQTNSPSATVSETSASATTLSNFLAIETSSTAGVTAALLRVPLVPLGEDTVAILRRPVEVVRIDDLADVLRQAFGHREARQRDGGEVLRVEAHRLLGHRPVEELLRGRAALALLRERVGLHVVAGA